MIVARPQDELETRVSAMAAEVGLACTDMGDLCRLLLAEVRCTACELAFKRYQVRPLIQTPHGFLYVCRGCAAKENAR